jgi:hypothetical protein
MRDRPAIRKNPRLLREIGEALRRETRSNPGLSALERSRLQFEKWRLIHSYVHHTPFSDRPHLPRSRQWQDVIGYVHDIGELDLIDWVRLQVEVASNLENGIQDMRPRKNGPCHGVMLEYVANRKRKARAVLRFAEEGERDGLFTVNSRWHNRTRAILGDVASARDQVCGGHEGVPWVVPGAKK